MIAAASYCYTVTLKCVFESERIKKRASEEYA